MTIDPETAEVKAGGGLVVRPGESGHVVALVHRPRYDDWSFPKGKLDRGESFEDGALREVEEEIGLRCRLGKELSPVTYRDRKGRSKVVRYWLMEPIEGEFVPSTTRSTRCAGCRSPTPRSFSATSTTASCCARPVCEPRPLPRPPRRLGAAGRAGRHADGRQRDRRRWTTSCARATTPTTAACSRRPCAPTSWSRARAPASRRCSAPTRAASRSGRA